MNLKKKLLDLRDEFVSQDVKKIDLPMFDEGSCYRVHIIFIGEVQGVGFRIQLAHLAGRIGLVGWVRNLLDGNVEAEIQGTQERVDFLIEQMKGLKRIRIDEAVLSEIDCQDAHDFKIKYD